MELLFSLLPVLGASVAAMALGALWHGPVFGKQWMALEGFTADSMKNMPLTARQAIALGFVNIIVITFVLDRIMSAFNVTDMGSVITLVLWVWLGFVVTTHANSVLWEGRSAKLWLFNIVYQFASLALTGAVLLGLR